MIGRNNTTTCGMKLDIAALLGFLCSGTIAKEWQNAVQQVFHDEAFESDRSIKDVVVVGGGASGTYAATRLRAHGLSVALVENLDRLGGHSQTFTDPETQVAIEYGVVFFHDDKVTRDFLDHYHIVPYRDTIIDPALHHVEFFDLGTGKRTDFQPPPASEVLAALQRYVDLLSRHYPYLERGYDLPNPIPEELTIPFLDFLRKHELEAMLNIAFQIGQGYGDFLHEPTLYAMKILSLGLLESVAHGRLLRMQNNSELYARAQAELASDGGLYLRSSIMSAGRRRSEHDLTELLVRTPLGKKRLRARQILITIPPTMPNLSTWLDLDAREKSLFVQFKSNYYAAGILRHAQLPSFEVQNVKLDNPGAVPALPGIYVFEATEVPGIHTFWYGAPSGTNNQSEATVRQDVVDTIARLRNSSAVPDLDREIEFLAFGDFSPFACMVDAQTIHNGFYRDLYALQGYRGTWWSGAAWHTHDSSALWAFTEQIVSDIRRALRK